MKLISTLIVTTVFLVVGLLSAEEKPTVKKDAPAGDSWTKEVKDPEKRGTLHDAFQRVRGDSGKWNDDPRLQPAPPIKRKPDKSSLDDWADLLVFSKVSKNTPNDDNWLLFKTRQLDDNDRVWVQQIERKGNEFTVVLHEAIWQGRYQKSFTYYNVYGVNLGKLPPGDYTAKLIIKPLEFLEFAGNGRPRGEDRHENWSKDEQPADQKPAELSVKFEVLPARKISGSKLKVFILAGQSNMAGQGDPMELTGEFQKHPENVMMPIPPRERKGRQPTDLVPFAPFPERFGPEVGFAHAMAKAWPEEKIVLIKKAIGGTSALAWAPDWTRERAALTKNERVGPLYKNLMEQLVEPIRERYGDDVEIAGVLWAQGGRDGRYEQAAKQYEQNLKKIIAAFRKDLGNPKLPFILAHTVDAQGRGFPHMDQIRAAQERIAKADPHSVLVSSANLSTKRDKVHFDTKGQLELGQRFAKAYLELVKE